MRLWAGGLVAAAALAITAIVAWPTRPAPLPGVSGITGVDLAGTPSPRIRMGTGWKLEEPSAPAAGDVNGDGRVDVLDARALAASLGHEARARIGEEAKKDAAGEAGYALRQVTPGVVADADADGLVDRRDVLAVLRAATAMTGVPASEVVAGHGDEASGAAVAGQPADAREPTEALSAARSAPRTLAAPPDTAWFDVTIDPEGEPLGAYQVEVSAPSREGFTGRIIGVEGSVHPAYRAVPAFDGTALGRERLILAAFSLREELPSGPTRVARFQVRYEPVAAPGMTPEEAMKAARRVETPAPAARAASPGVPAGPRSTAPGGPPASSAGPSSDGGKPEALGSGGGGDTAGGRSGIKVIAGDASGRAVRATARVTPAEGPIR